MNVVYVLCLLEGCHYFGSMDVITLAVTPVALSKSTHHHPQAWSYLFAPKRWVRVKLTHQIHPLGFMQPVPSPVPPLNRYNGVVCRSRERRPKQATSPQLTGQMTYTRDFVRLWERPPNACPRHMSMSTQNLDFRRLYHEEIPALPRNPSDTPKKICLTISTVDDGFVACEFTASIKLPLISYRTVAVIAKMDIVMLRDDLS